MYYGSLDWPGYSSILYYRIKDLSQLKNYDWTFDFLKVRLFAVIFLILNRPPVSFNKQDVFLIAVLFNCYFVLDSNKNFKVEGITSFINES